MVDQCISEFGEIDVPVNSAGMLNEVAPVDMDVSTWDQMIAVDMRIVSLCCPWTVPHMLSRGAGRIINIASQLGSKGSEGLVHYGAAKAGAIGQTKALTRELAPSRVPSTPLPPDRSRRRSSTGSATSGSRPRRRAAAAAARTRLRGRSARGCWASDPDGNL